MNYGIVFLSTYCLISSFKDDNIEEYDFFTSTMEELMNKPFKNRNIILKPKRFRSFEKLISYYKSNITEPLFTSDFELSEDDKKIILDVWNQYKELI
jgi:hypothetical protein